MAQAKNAPPRGVIHPPVRTAPLPLLFEHHRYVVTAPLDASIEHFWSVRWQMKGDDEQPRSTLGHPSFHLSVDDDGAWVTGVIRGRYTWLLRGGGAVFAAKFHPGAFRTLLNEPASAFTDRRLPLSSVLGARRSRELVGDLRGCNDDDERVACAFDFLCAIVPPPPSDHALLMRLIQLATSDRSIKSVEDLRAHCGLHVRDLQRWWSDVVGISPKWMIRRYRLHDALSALEAGDTSVADIAADLGYADQAHFARDFKSVVGVAPSHYRGAHIG